MSTMRRAGSVLTRFSSILLLSFACLPLAASSASAQNVHECDTPDLEIAAGGIDSSTFTVEGDEEIIELNVRLTLSTTFVGCVDAVVLTHEGTGTALELHTGGDSETEAGGLGNDFDLTYADSGRVNSKVGSPVRDASHYDCHGCLWRAAEDLSVFDGLETESDWTLQVKNGPVDSRLDRWCIVNYELAPVKDVSCEIGDEEGSWEVTWTNGGNYDRVDVVFDGELLVSETFRVNFDQEVTVSSGATNRLPLQQYAVIEVIPVIEGSRDVLGAPNTCALAVLADVAASVGEGPALGEEFSGESPYSGTATFEEDVEIADLAVRVHASGPWVARSAHLQLTSPAGTTVVMHDTCDADTSDETIDVTFWELGARPGACGGDDGAFDCDGARIQPAESLSAFAGESTMDGDDGTWTLEASNGYPKAAANTLHEWRLDVFTVAPALPVHITSCGQVGDPGEVEVEFETGSAYSAVEIWVNDELRETLTPTGSAYDAGEEITWTSSESSSIPGAVLIAIRGVSESDAKGPWTRCSVPVFVPPIRDLTVTKNPDGGADLRWTNGMDGYDGIDLYIDDVVAEAYLIEGDDTELLGRTTDSSGVAFASPTSVVFRLEPYLRIDGVDHVAESTAIWFLDHPDFDFDHCAYGSPDPEERATSLSVDIVADEAVEAVRAVTDVTADDFDVTRVDLTSPSGTTVRLHDVGGDTLNSSGRSLVFWTDDGATTSDGTDYGCVCELKPQGSPFPWLADELAVFIGETTAGSWTCTISGPFAFDGDRDLEKWCLSLATCPVTPATDVTCNWVPTEDSDDLELTWVNGSTYRAVDGIEIVDVGGGSEEVLATFDGDEQEVVVESVARGTYDIVVRAYFDIDDCTLDSIDSAPCRVTVGDVYEACRTEELSLVGRAFAERVRFDESVHIADVQVSLDWASSFAPTALFLVSPADTEVCLISAGSGYDLAASFDRLECVFHDRGEELVPDDPTNGDGLVKDPVGDLSDFVDEFSGGEWTLTGSPSPLGAATLREWCVSVVENCRLDAPSDSTCVGNGDLEVTLNWINNGNGEDGAYDAIFIDRDGEEWVEIDGDETEYVGTVPEGGYYTFQIRVFDESLNCYGASVLHLTSVGFTDGCRTFPPADFGDNPIGPLEIAEFVIDFQDDVECDDVELLINLETPNVKDWYITVTNAAGTTITLHDRLGGRDLACPLYVIYSDEGIVNDVTTTDYDFFCECRMEPYDLSNGEVASMADLAEGDTSGDWTLMIENVHASKYGTLDEWCIYLIDEIEPKFLRGDVDGDGVVSALSDTFYLLAWAFGDGDPGGCKDAADVNDDGSVSALTDSLALLRWAFEDGAAPPDPGIEECGLDTTESDLDCSEIADECQ